jgi:hemerythrin-like domain-containing protein
MKPDITAALVEEHRLILRMIALLERNAPLTAEGRYDNWQFYLDGVDFIRNFADRFHHAKEEAVLFEALVKNGMPREHSPVGAMLMEHEQGRALVRAMEEEAGAASANVPGAAARMAENALAYASLLREHIGKEDNILYPLAERLIPDSMRDGILERYAKADTAADRTQRYLDMVERYEREHR